MINTYEDIKNEYERIRQANHLKTDERKEKVYSKYPELEEMDKKIMKAFVSLVKSEAYEDKKIEEDIVTLRKKRIAFLKEHKIEDNYRDVIYNCEKCKDTGFVNGKKCSCYVEKEIELFDHISNFKKYIEDDNFDNLRYEYYKQEDMTSAYLDYMKENIKEMRDAIANIDKEPINLLINGNPGTGKTFLARCLGADCIRQQKSVLYLNVVEYIDSLKPDFTGTPLKQYAMICDLFILDDLGTEYSSEFSKTELNYIIDKRLNNKKSTIVTSNIAPNKLKDRYLDSMCSRLINMYKNIHLSGVDLRRYKNANFK